MHCDNAAMKLHLNHDARRYLSDNNHSPAELESSVLQEAMAASFTPATVELMFKDGVIDLTEAQAFLAKQLVFWGQSRLITKAQAHALNRLASQSETADTLELPKLALRAFLVADPQHTPTSLTQRLADPESVAKLVSKGLSTAAAQKFVASSAPGTQTPTNDEEAQVLAWFHALCDKAPNTSSKTCVALMHAFKSNQASLIELTRVVARYDFTDATATAMLTKMAALPADVRVKYATFLLEGGTPDEAKAIQRVVAKQQPKKQYACFSAGMKLAEKLRTMDPNLVSTEPFNKALHFATEFQHWSLPTWLEDPTDLELLSYPDIGTLLARRMSVAKVYAITAALDELHTIETDTKRFGDRIRKSFMAHAKNEHLVAVLSNPMAFTSTFRMALDELTRRPGAWPAAILDFAKEQGSLELLATSMTRFRALDELFAARHLMLEPTLASIERVPNYAGMSAPFLVRVLKQGSAEEKQKLQAWLLVQTADRKNPGAFLLRTCFDAQALSNPQLISRAQALPPISDSNDALKVAVRDKKFVQYLFFYPDEKSFDATGERLRAAGFRSTSKGKDRVTLQRVLNGQVQIIHMSQDSETSRQAAYSDPDMDMMAHRGHSYHLQKTFPNTLQRNAALPPAILYLGSCGAAGQMVGSEDALLFTKHAWIADENTGQSLTNDAALLALNDGLAAGKSTWTELLGSFSQNGLLLPDDPAFGVARYAEQLQLELKVDEVHRGPAVSQDQPPHGAQD